MLRYDDGGGLSFSLLSLLSSLDESSSSQGWIRCRQICFFAALEFGVYDFCSSQICHELQMGKLAGMFGDASIDGW